MRRRGTFKVKVLGLLTLVVIGAMAASASAAQAKWVLKKNGEAVLSLGLKAVFGLKELLAPSLSLAIHCSAGSANATLSLNAGPTPPAHTVLTSSGSAKFTSYVMLKAEKTCAVHSVGAPVGTIASSWNGLGQMSGGNTFLRMESSNFATLVIEGALCPLNEFEEAINGTLNLTLNGAAAEAASHGLELDNAEKGLFFGENELTIDGALTGMGESKEDAVKGTATEETGATWSLDLEGL